MKKVIAAACYIICWVGFAYAIETYNTHYKSTEGVHAPAVHNSPSQTPYLDEWLTSMQQKERIAEPIIRPVNKNSNLYVDKSTEATFGKNVSVYTSNPRDPKTHGRKIRVEYPKDWEAKPGTKPHNVYKFTDTKYAPNLLEGRACVINVLDINEMSFNEDIPLVSWKIIFNNQDFAKALFGDTLLYSQATQADNLPALMAMTEITQEQLGIKIYQKMLSVSIGYKNTLINLQCIAMGRDKNSANRVFNESKKTFLNFMNSFQCLDRLETPDAEDEELYYIYKKASSFASLNMDSNAYQELATFLSEKAEVGGICINTQKDINNMRQNPKVILAYSWLSMYYRNTHWIKDYCTSYNTNLYNSISKIKIALEPYKKQLETQIANAMGAQYLQCLTEALSTSEDAEFIAYATLDELLIKAKLSKRDMCITFNNEYETSALISQSIQTFSTMGF